MTIAALRYPLTLRFRILTVGAEIEGTDAGGGHVLFVKQKAFRLKEDVLVFRDATRAEQLYRIRADRIIDIGARYAITDPAGTALGAVRQRGMRTLWRATYDILGPDGEVLGVMREENAWVKVLDGIIGEIPILGLALAMLVNPKYMVEAPAGTPVLRVVKRRSLIERRFLVEQVAPLPAAVERIAPASLATLVLLERARG